MGALPRQRGEKLYLGMCISLIMIANINSIIVRHFDISMSKSKYFDLHKGKLNKNRIFFLLHLFPTTFTDTYWHRLILAVFVLIIILVVRICTMQIFNITAEELYQNF